MKERLMLESIYFDCWKELLMEKYIVEIHPSKKKKLDYVYLTIIGSY